MALELDQVGRYLANFRSSPNHRLAKSVLNNVNIDRLVNDPDVVVQREFKHTVMPHKLPLTDQYSSGRCWIFAFTNMLRRKMIKQYKLPEEFMLSQKYLLFFDHLEKCNALMEVMYFMVKHKGVDVYSLELTQLTSNYISDGGTWDFFVNLVLKYGLVPYETYPDNFQAANTTDLNDILSQHVRSNSTAIANAATEREFKRIKTDIMQACYNIIESFLGAPPSEFDWTYRDKANKYHNKKYSPLQFYETVVKPTADLKKFMVLINDPRQPYNKLYSVELLHNVLPVTNTPLDELPSNLYFNVDLDIMKQAVHKSIMANMPVPFTADVNHYMFSSDARLDTGFNYEDIVGVSFLKPRDALYQNLVTSPNHAMLFVGCNGEQGEWQVENSWGDMTATYPYLTMSKEWFDHYIGMVIVPKRIVPKHIVQQYETAKATCKVRMYPFWDIFGTVARKRLAAGSISKAKTNV